MNDLEQHVLTWVKFTNTGCVGKKTTGENILPIRPYKKVEEYAKTLLYIVWVYPFE